MSSVCLQEEQAPCEVPKTEGKECAERSVRSPMGKIRDGDSLDG